MEEEEARAKAMEEAAAARLGEEEEEAEMQEIPEGACLALPPCKHEYLDHTADVQVHAWGEDLREALEQAVVAMFGYITELPTVEMTSMLEVTAEAEDLEGLLFHLLDEFLYSFSAEPNFVARKVTIVQFDRAPVYRVRARGFGEAFRLGKHPQGTEVKAITYGSMQIIDDTETDKHELFVILDI